MPPDQDVERLIEAITQKLTADKAVLARSLRYGRLTWRRDGRGRLEVKIQPEL